MSPGLTALPRAAAGAAATQLPVLIQVSPTERGGVFDYLECLGARWAAAGTPSHTLPLSKALAREQSLDERVAECCRRSGRAAHGEPCTVVLHFSGYGYGQRGLCFWLLHELQALRRRRQGSLHLVVVFHELFATGPPWRSAFWVSDAQAWIARRLARLADVMWTNTAAHANWLRGVMPRGTPLHARPVFSNVGEPLHTPRLVERAPRAVVFGSAPTRLRAFNALRGHEPALKAMGIEELVEAGSGAACHPQGVIPTRHVGRLGAEALGQLLMSSRFGIVDYEAHGLAKSGVFAAYASHGCVAINTSHLATNDDGLQAGLDYHLLSPGSRPDSTSLATQQDMADRLYRWYQRHRLEQQAKELLVLSGAS
ncbi:hypothetical protein LRS03_03225 [Rhizobacter sp. J219]|uniref:hypothetical protein n=1 Tax=Rhizobacter sp. J219 TaxID=2898430 RepID=UPI0021518791|nr:hypothetical protein [Rhizobacter sp. J219]MCR5881924.1 hypothetical protein [Rhizobacter sp. J219]